MPCFLKLVRNNAGDIRGWWIWVYWINPLTYSLRALTLNEFTDVRWDIPDPQNPSQVRLSTVCIDSVLSYNTAIVHEP